jgi:competence ComEA-like helix-hairpin-helix protein
MFSKLYQSAGHRVPAPGGVRNAFAFLVLGLLLLSGVAQAGTESAQALLDLNRATAEQLEALPGIGEVKAAAILAVREARGGFQSVDDLEAVRGIGPSLAAKLRPLVKVEARARKSAQAAKK